MHPYEKGFIFLKMHRTCIFTEFNSCRKKTLQFVQVNVTRLKSKARENVHNLRGKQFLGRYIGRGLLSPTLVVVVGCAGLWRSLYAAGKYLLYARPWTHFDGKSIFFKVVAALRESKIICLYVLYSLFFYIIQFFLMRKYIDNWLLFQSKS